MALPGTSGLAMNLTGGPMLLAHPDWLCAERVRYPFEGALPPQFGASARVTFVDAAVDRYLATIGQFVIRGAGFDTRAFRLPRPDQIRCFDVDMPQTQSTPGECYADRQRTDGCSGTAGMTSAGRRLDYLRASARCQRSGRRRPRTIARRVSIA